MDQPPLTTRDAEQGVALGIAPVTSPPTSHGDR